MEEIVKECTYERLLVSKDNIIIEVSRSFLELTGYTEMELVGKTLLDGSKTLKIDGQVNLQDMDEIHSLYVFTKEDLGIDLTITCEVLIKENIKNFYFKENIQEFLRNILLNFEDLTISKKQALAIYSYPGCVCLKTNKKYMESLDSINIKDKNPLGKPYIYPEYLSRLTEERGSFYEDEVEFINSDEISSYWDMSIRLILGDENKEYIMLSLYDVSDKVIEKRFHDKKRIEMELILENISDVITIVNNKGDFIYVNKAGVDKLNPYGPEAKSLEVKERFRLFHFKDIDGNELLYEETPVQRVLRGESINGELFVGTSHLPTSYHECIGIPIYDDLGNIDGGILTYRDVGDRIKAEEERALKKEEEFQRQRLEGKLLKAEKEHMNKIMEARELEFIGCTYPDLEIMSINGNSLNSLKKINDGISSIDSLIGETFNIIYPIYDVSKIKEWKYFLIAKEDYTHIDYTDHIRNGEERVFKTIAQPIFGLEGKVVEVIFITTDITEEAKAKEKIEQTLEMQNQMFSTISHELKTPLGIIFSSSQLIEMYLKEDANKINKEKINRNINMIKQNCYRFTKLINNIIDLSSIESGFYRLNFTNRNIVETVEDIVDSVRYYVEDKGLRIIFDTEMEEKIIAVDLDKMERIILNLISNAMKFSDKGENIYVNINDKVDFVEILIRDNGMGIDKVHLDTIFDKYKKLDNSLSRRSEGSGIGLALVKTMVKLLGGEISVESELGKGSLFIVRLPVKVLDEVKSIKTMDDSDNIMERINIELSDIY